MFLSIPPVSFPVINATKILFFQPENSTNVAFISIYLYNESGETQSNTLYYTTAATYYLQASDVFVIAFLAWAATAAECLFDGLWLELANVTS